MILSHLLLFWYEMQYCHQKKLQTVTIYNPILKIKLSLRLLLFLHLIEYSALCFPSMAE